MMNNTITNALIFLPFIPLVTSLIMLFWGNMLPRQGKVLIIFSSAASFVLSAAVLIQVTRGVVSLPWSFSTEWFFHDFYPVILNLRVDALSLVLMTVITCLNLMIHSYSVYYINSISRVRTYYVFASLSAAGISIFLMAGDMLVMLCASAVIGSCSFFMSSYFHEDTAVLPAIRRSYFMLGLSDIGLWAMLFLLYEKIGTVHIGQIFNHAASSYIQENTLVIISGLIIITSAVRGLQMPFYIWLLRAVECPLPISVLAYGTTISVTGVYLMLRFFSLCSSIAWYLPVLAWLGAVTALAGAVLALAAIDMRYMLVYAFASELGFVFLALGTGNPGAALSHMISVLFVMTVVFLTLGAVVCRMPTFDLRDMGGLAKHMPVTAMIFFAGAVSLAGVWPAAGFFTKYRIFDSIGNGQSRYLLWMAGAAFFAASFYSFRMWYLVFAGDARNVRLYEKADEPPAGMLVPLVILEVVLFTFGWLMRHGNSIEWVFSERVSRVVSWDRIGMFAAVSFGGMLASWGWHQKRFQPQGLLEKIIGILHNLLSHNFWLDKKYDQAVACGAHISSQSMNIVETRVVHGMLAALLTGCVRVAVHSAVWIDSVIINGFLRGFNSLLLYAGDQSRKMQGKYIQQQLFLLVLAVWILISSIVF